MLPVMMLIEAPVDGKELYQVASGPLGLSNSSLLSEGTRTHLQGLRMVHPNMPDLGPTEDRNDLAVWFSDDGEVRWDENTWRHFYCELEPMFPLGAVVILDSTALNRYPDQQADAIKALATYCEQKGLRYWWTSRARGFGWEIGDPLWSDSLENLYLLTADESEFIY